MLGSFFQGQIILWLHQECLELDHSITRTTMKAGHVAPPPHTHTEEADWKEADPELQVRQKHNRQAPVLVGTLGCNSNNNHSLVVNSV